MWEGPKEGGHNQSPRVLPAGIHPGWEMQAPQGRTLCQTTGQARWLARDNPETNAITIKHETVSHVAEQFSWVPLSRCSPPGRHFPIKSLAVSARVSSRTIHFQVLDKSPLSGPGRGPPSCNKTTHVDGPDPTPSTTGTLPYAYVNGGGWGRHGGGRPSWFHREILASYIWIQAKNRPLLHKGQTSRGALGHPLCGDKGEVQGEI